MSLTGEEEQGINEALQVRFHGDVFLDAAGLEFVHLADLRRPYSPASVKVADDILADDGGVIEVGATAVADKVPGLVMLNCSIPDWADE